MAKYNISDSVIRRLPRYYRFLCGLRERGMVRISSGELARRMGLNASQIRQDFNCFGGFGQQGYGYNVEEMCLQIAEILGLDKPHKAVLIGAGNLGRAVSQQMNFERAGFSLVGIFDKKEAIIGQMIGKTPIRSIDTLDEFCRAEQPDTAILCLPATAASDVVEQLIALGIKGFWNFSHYDIAVEHKGVTVENVHLVDSLMTLCYKIEHSVK